MTNGNGNGTQHTNWDEQRERLSAYLDGELDDGERKLLEAHLVECAACRRELAELRQVRKLLRAMPTPALPRSFTLPVDEPVAAPATPAARAGRAAPTRTAASAPRRESRLARAAQWTGGLAASVGLFLILGAALAGGAFSHPSGGASSAAGRLAPTSQNSSNGASASSTATHPPQHLLQGDATQSPHPTSSASPSVSPAASPAQPGDTSTSTYAPASSPTTGSGASNHQAQFGDEATPTPPASVVGLTGAGLAGGGALLFVGGTIGRRRRNRRR